MAPALRTRSNELTCPQGPPCPAQRGHLRRGEVLPGDPRYASLPRALSSASCKHPSDQFPAALIARVLRLRNKAAGGYGFGVKFGERCKRKAGQREDAHGRLTLPDHKRGAQ